MAELRLLDKVDTFFSSLGKLW